MTVALPSIALRIALRLLDWLHVVQQLEMLTKLTDPQRGANNAFLSILKACADFPDDRTGQKFGPVDAWGLDRIFIIDSLTELSNAAMKMQIGWWGPRPKPGLAWPRADSLMALARQSDIVIVACRADENNRGMIDAAIMEAVGADGLLVNVARGQLVQEAALIEALRTFKRQALHARRLHIHVIEAGVPQKRAVSEHPDVVVCPVRAHVLMTR